MALKGRRYEFKTTLRFHLNEAATRGGCVVMSTAGSGAALDQSSSLVTYAADPSGSAPIGILLNDMVDQDQTRYRPFWVSFSVQMAPYIFQNFVGSKTTLQLANQRFPIGGSSRKRQGWVQE